MKELIFAIAVFCFAVGAVAVWLNPRKFPIQVFALLSVFISVWIGSVAYAIHERDQIARGLTGHPLLWLRVNGAMTAFIAWGLWFLNEAVLHHPNRRPAIIRTAILWLGPSMAFAWMCFTDYYILSESTVTTRRFSIFYWAGAVGIFFWVSWLLVRTVRVAREQAGMRRVEIQFLSLNLCVAFILVLLSTVVGNLLGLQWLRRCCFAVYLGSYCLAAWALAFHRRFDARQILLSLAQRLVLVALFWLSFISISRHLAGVFPAPVDLFANLALCISMTLWFDRKSREWLRLGGEHAIARLRAEAIMIARTESPERLIHAFRELLQEEFLATSTILTFARDEVHTPSELGLPSDLPAYHLLCELGWATPESLDRRRPDPATVELTQFLHSRALSLVVAVPRGTPTPSLIVALGMKQTKWPYTALEVQRVQNVAELMDNILTRSRLTAHAALKNKTEHLAMMSRGLAHDLKNLITPISSFLIHAENRVVPGTVEEEVHATAKRSVRIMNDYIREALFFANRLEPRFEPVSTGKIFEAVHELTAPRASRRQVKLVVAVESDHPLVADAVLLQRMLGNLVCNAIDASSPGKIVTLSALPHQARTLRISIVDQGSGIAPQHLGRIFEPYFTTKEFGDDVRGFGLGLTISQKIVHLHHGTISVQSQLGCGTAVTIDLPFTQPAPADRMTEHSLAETTPIPLASAPPR